MAPITSGSSSPGESLSTTCRGELIQIDGSDHEWFEERASRGTLLVFVDDATSALMALLFGESESAFSYFAAMRAYLETHGGTGVTQFSRALGSLNIDIVCANTPAATVSTGRGGVLHCPRASNRRSKASSISSCCRSRWPARRASAIFLFRMPNSQVRTLDRPSKRGADSIKVVNVACVTSSAS